MYSGDERPHTHNRIESVVTVGVPELASDEFDTTDDNSSDNIIEESPSQQSSSSQKSLSLQTQQTWFFESTESRDAMHIFWNVSWLLSRYRYLLLRGFLAFSQSSLLVFVIATCPIRKCLLYFGSVTFILSTVYFISYFALVYASFHGHLTDGLHENTLPFLVKTTWSLKTVVYPSSIVSFMIYFPLLFSKRDSFVGDFSIPFYRFLIIHTLNILFIICDWLFSNSPFFMAHFWMTLVYGCTYVVMTYVLFLIGFTNGDNNPFLYETLNWENGRLSGVTTGLLLFLLLISHVIFGLIDKKMQQIKLYLRPSCVLE